MGSVYNFGELTRLLNSLSLITGRKITLKDETFRDILTSAGACGFCRLIQDTEYGHQKCLACDRRALTHARRQGGACLYRCHAGLTEAAVPVMGEGQLVGYLMYGQVLDEAPSEAGWRRIEARCGWHGRLPELKEAYFGLEHLSRETLEAYAEVLNACASYIWLHRYAQRSRMTDAQRLKAYVEENYARPLTLERLSSELGVGKTKLCLAARQELGCSVQQLVRRRRVEAARQLLESGGLSVGEIGEAVGICDSDYFIKTFKQLTGQTPLRYRKEFCRGRRPDGDGSHDPAGTGAETGGTHENTAERSNF